MRSALAFAAAFLAGCSYIPTLPGTQPFVQEIQQGNFINQEMVSKLRPGMTREEVRFVLGTPLVSDIFHKDRWDYIFRRIPQGGGSAEQRRITVYFEDSKLSKVEGDVVIQPGTGTVPDAGSAAKPVVSESRGNEGGK